MPPEEPSGRQRKLVIAAAVLLVVAGGVAWYLSRGETAADIASNRVYMCVKTGKIFEHTIELGETEPVKSPHSGELTGYAAESCYWTKGPDGKFKAKLKPTYVVLKKRVDPKSKEKTYCPDCGREVKPHNPLPPEKLMLEAEQEAKQNK